MVLYWVALPTQFYFFFLSIFKTDNNLKNITANYHLHSISIFLHYQIRFLYAHARVLAFEYKITFSVLYVRMLTFFKNLYIIKFLEDRPVSVCKVKCLILQRNTRNLDWLSASVHRTFQRDRHDGAKRSTPLQLSLVGFTLQKQDGQIEEKSIGTGINLFIAVVWYSVIQQFVEMCTILKEIPLKWRFRHFYKTTPVSDMRHFHANGSTLITDLQRLSLQMTRLFLCHIWSEFLK